MELKDVKIGRLNDDELLSVQYQTEAFLKFLDSELVSAKKLEEEKS